jgi:hypothetical protein
MKKSSKLCWFCEKKCYSFVSICSDCVKEKQKNTQIFAHKTTLVKQLQKDDDVKKLHQGLR